MMKFSSRLTKFTLASTLVASSLIGSAQVTKANENQQNAQGQDQNQNEAAVYGNTENPKNVIFLVGDGMGPAYNTAYRYFADNPETKEIEKTAFDDYLVGTQRTESEDPEETVTDSAAAATAFSAGHKTYNGAIGVDLDKEPVVILR